MRRRIVEEYDIIFTENHHVKAQVWLSSSGIPYRVVVETRHVVDGGRIDTKVTLYVNNIVCHVDVVKEISSDRVSNRIYYNIVSPAWLKPERLYEMIRRMAGGG